MINDDARSVYEVVTDYIDAKSVDLVAAFEDMVEQEIYAMRSEIERRIRWHVSERDLRNIEEIDLEAIPASSIDWDEIDLSDLSQGFEFAENVDSDDLADWLGDYGFISPVDQVAV